MPDCLACILDACSLFRNSGRQQRVFNRDRHGRDDMKIPPLKGLYTFEAIVRNGSFKAAAEELCLSRSAVSHQIKALEDQLKMPLLERQQPGITMTEAGRALYETLHDAFANVRQSLTRLEAATNDAVVAIALAPHFALKWFLPRLPDLRKRHPTLQINMSYPVPGRPNSDPNVQISINWLEDGQASPDAMRLVDGSLYPLCNPALLANETAAEPADLLRTVLLHERNDTYWRQWFAAAGVEAYTPARSEMFDDSNVVVQAALDGQGVALICASLAQAEIESGRLICPFDIGLHGFAYYATVAPAYKDQTKVQRVLDWLKGQRET